MNGKTLYILSQAIAAARLGQIITFVDPRGRHHRVQPTDTVEALYAKSRAELTEEEARSIADREALRSNRLRYEEGGFE